MSNAIEAIQITSAAEECATRLKDLIFYLQSRWQDESEYEDIKDYKDRLQKECAQYGYTVVSIHTTPFTATVQMMPNVRVRFTVVKDTMDVTLLARRAA